MSGDQRAQTLRARLISGGVWTLAGRVLTVISGFAVNVLIARMMTAEEVGAYFLLVSVISVGVLVASLGMQVAVVRLVAQAIAQQLPGVARSTVGAVIRIGAVSALIGAAAIGLAGDFIAIHIFNTPRMADVMWLAAGLLLVRVPLGLLAESFRGFHAFGLSAIFSNNTISNVIMVIMLTVVMAVGAGSDLQQVVLISIVASVIGVVIAGMVMGGRMLSLGASASVPFKSVLDASFPLMLSGVSIFVLTQADLWIVGMFTSAEDVAIYGAAIRTAQLIFMPLLIGNTMLAPFVAELYVQGEVAKLERVIRSASAVSAIVACLMLAFFLVAGEDVLALAFGDYYRDAYSILIVISIGQCVNTWCGPGIITLINTGHQKSVMYISLVFGGLMIIGSLLVVESLGILGVALMMGFIIATQAIFTLYLVKRKTGIWVHAGMRYVPFIWKRFWV